MSAPGKMLQFWKDHVPRVSEVVKILFRHQDALECKDIGSSCKKLRTTSNQFLDVIKEML